MRAHGVTVNAASKNMEAPDRASRLPVNRTHYELACCEDRARLLEKVMEESLPQGSTRCC